VCTQFGVNDQKHQGLQQSGSLLRQRNVGGQLHATSMTWPGSSNSVGLLSVLPMPMTGVQLLPAVEACLHVLGRVCGPPLLPVRQ
jgi:hypothetical protein